MKTHILITTLFVLTLVLPINVGAHSGNVDVYGCHHVLPGDTTDTYGKEYHCHDGSGAQKYCSDKFYNDPNLPKALAQRKYEDCIRNTPSDSNYVNPATQNSIDSSTQSWQKYEQDNLRREEELRQMEIRRQQNDAEWEAYFNSLIEQKNKSTCPNNSTLGSDNMCYCNAGYAVVNSQCVFQQIKQEESPSIKTCIPGFIMNSNGECKPTKKNCEETYGKDAKINNKGDCLYCPQGYYVDDNFNCSLKNVVQKKDIERSHQATTTNQSAVLKEVTSKPSLIKKLRSFFYSLFTS